MLVVRTLATKSTYAGAQEVFAKEYPNDSPNNHQANSGSVAEATKRMMILKKMDRNQKDLSQVEEKKLRQFYFSIAQSPKEPWPVRVQAFRNLRNMKGFISWSDREQILKEVDKRILHLSQYSEEEILEQVVEHGQTY